ncbi:aminotransferase class V-fold PLP-dependent enzyme [Actinocrispum wychmicini]|uniref:Selenocysteine lyase/cysteine desulfurase n=1 Tax=Actinocrispum wychmicini TaxID=1213861 RepID=A0A4R2J5Y8_9PSEU|nr:aminotransferase class V-fold PLP-dependent enzyme [Actinocrispum wychmicini]TCO54371.1 selenocysteine lyase/cysteine desulfurase [Actinocrispum wychmicini]
MIPKSVLPRVLGSDLQVPLADGATATFANFDHAATTPCMAAVAEAVNDFLPWYGSTHGGAGTLSEMATARFEESRQAVRRFVGCRPDDYLVFTHSTTDALKLLAQAVPEDATVVVFDSEHHAVLLPWRNVHRLPIPTSVDAMLATLDQTLRAQRGTVLVAVSGVLNVTGELVPLEDVVAVCRRYGAQIVVDAAQLAAHRPIDIGALDVDYIAFSGHKMYAPFDIGVLAGRPDWLADAHPRLAGCGATIGVADGVTEINWATGESRHEAGAPNVVGAVALAAACRALEVAWNSLMPYESALLGRLRSGLVEIPEVVELSLFGPASDRLGMVAFVVDGLDSALLATALSLEHGIGVRHGSFCAQPLARHLLRGAGRSATATALRASLGLGINVAHVDRLLDAVRAISEIGPQLFYVSANGAWWPSTEATSSRLRAR